MSPLPPSELKAKLEEILRPRLRLLPAGVPLDFNEKLAKLGLDSMAAIDLLMDLETEAGAQIPDELLTADTFATAQNLLDTIEKLAA
ncbi:MAG: phosphopantetheine-binding [Verrucomicrobiaceae bacterium]|nr:phosphopantetheine-binding [Verrucomicrobiaceae bacterium]